MMNQHTKPRLAALLTLACATLPLTGVAIAAPAGAATRPAVAAPAGATSPSADDLAAIKTRLDRLTTQVAALPSDTPERLRTRIALKVVLEQAALLLPTGRADRATALASDVEAALTKPVGREVTEQSFFLPFTPDKQIVREFDLGVTEILAKPDEALPAPTPDKSSFKDVGTSRTNGELMFDYLVAAAHPDSAHKSKTELFERMYRRASAFIESQYVSRKDANMGEFFTLDFNLFALYCLDKVYPDLLLPSQRTGLAEGLGFQFGKLEMRYKAGDLVGWCNSDVSYSSGLIHGGLLIKQPKFVDIGRAVIARHISEQFPDGGFQYIRGQNECIGYHHVMPRVFNHLWLTQRDETARAAILRTRNYSLLSVEPPIVGNFAMSPAWKMNWNTSYSTSLEAAYHTQDPFLKTYQVVRHEYADELRKKGDFNPLKVMLDLTRVEAKPLPDQYTVYDANIQGPRGRYGPFAFSATGRPVTTPLGPQTFVGALLVGAYQPDRPLPLEAAVGGVFAGPSLAPSPKFNQIATIADQPVPTVMMGYDIAALTVRHGLSTQDFGLRKLTTTWSGHQQWVFLPDRMIGMVTVIPGSEPAASVNGRVRLLHGGTGVQYPKTLRQIDDRRFAYGDLQVTIHEQSFGRIDIEEKTPTLREGRNTATDVRLTDAASLAATASGTAGSSDALRRYDTPMHYIVEIRPASTSTDATIDRIDANGLTGIRVRVGGRDVVAVMNRTGGDMEVATADLLPASAQAQSPTRVLRAFRYGEENRPAADARFTLAASEGVLLVSGGTNADRPAWPSFTKLMESFAKGESGLPEYPLPGLNYKP